MSNFQDATHIHQSSDTLAATLDPAWGIWGPIGGYMAAIALRAAATAVGADHRPVSLSVQYIGRPTFDAITIEVVPVKGGNTALTNVRLHQSGQCFLQAQLWTTNKSQGPVTNDAQMPDVPPAETLESIETQLARHGRPIANFWQNLDARPVGFFAPPHPDPRGSVIQQWHQYRDFEPTPDLFLNAGRAALLIDVLIWPAHWRGQSVEPKYASPSLDLSLWFHDPGNQSAWLLADGHADTARDGVIHGGVRIWGEDGSLIASGGSHLLVIAPR